jgi:hypothetical protein
MYMLHMYANHHRLLTLLQHAHMHMYANHPGSTEQAHDHLS